MDIFLYIIGAYRIKKCIRLCEEIVASILEASTFPVNDLCHIQIELQLAGIWYFAFLQDKD